jgi:hypothetical protein
MAGPRTLRLAAAALLVLALGFALGVAYRRATHPTLEEKAERAAEDLRRAAERFTR